MSDDEGTPPRGGSGEETGSDWAWADDPADGGWESDGGARSNGGPPPRSRNGGGAARARAAADPAAEAQAAWDSDVELAARPVLSDALKESLKERALREATGRGWAFPELAEPGASSGSDWPEFDSLLPPSAASPPGTAVESWLIEDTGDLLGVRDAPPEKPRQVAFKLLLDDVTSESLVEAQGALMTNSNDITIVLPEHGPLVVGATSERACDVVLDDDRVSGRHLMFEVVDVPGQVERRVLLTDLHSTNGVYKNSAPLQPYQTEEVAIGDEVVLGGRAISRFRVIEAWPVDVQVRRLALSHRRDGFWTCARAALTALFRGSVSNSSGAPCGSGAAVAALVRCFFLARGRALQAASAISHVYLELRERDRSLKMAYRAWCTTTYQRCALGSLVYPDSALTRGGLALPHCAPLATANFRELCAAAVPMSCRSLGHEWQAAVLLRRFETSKALRYARQLCVSHPVRAQSWLLLSEVIMLTQRKYAEARKAARAAVECLQVAEVQVAGLEAAGVDTDEMRRRLAVLRIKVRPLSSFCALLTTKGYDRETPVHTFNPDGTAVRNCRC